MAALLATAASARSDEAGRAGDAIAARLMVMNQIALDMARAEDAARGDEVTEDMRAAAASLAASFAAFGHLFPEGSNLQGGAPPLEGVATTAAPGIWEDFGSFYRLVSEARDEALAMQAAASAPAYRQSLEALRLGCAGCHEAHVFYDPFAAFN